MRQFLLRIIIPVFVCIILPGDISSCTSAIIGADKNPYGRPLLWKHRDTSAIDNKVEYIAPEDGSYGYVALFNAEDKRNEQAWIGMNDVGFAVMNTASYNIKNDKVPESEMDKEGYLMTVALRSCRTVDDFGRLLEKLPRPLGVEANFGVIDAEGNGAFFETNNDSFRRFDLKDAQDHILIRTNYSRSGRAGEGYGHVRESNAEHLIRPVARESQVTPEFLTEVVSRSFYRDVEKKDYSQYSDRIIPDVDFIPRYKSTATVVVEGMKPVADAWYLNPGDVKNEYIMWTGLGYPPCAEIFPVWCASDGVAEILRGSGPDGHSPQSDIVKARRNDVFSDTKDKKQPYINMDKLVNGEGTGYVQILVPQNRNIYDRVRHKRDGGSGK